MDFPIPDFRFLPQKDKWATEPARGAVDFSIAFWYMICCIDKHCALVGADRF